MRITRLSPAALALLALAAFLTLTTGCISPNWIRLVPENKDLDAIVVTPYGTVTIKSRVNPYGTNGLGALPPTATPIEHGILLTP